MKNFIVYFLSVSLLSYPLMASSDENEFVAKRRVRTFSDQKETDIFTGFLYKIRLKSSMNVLDNSDRKDNIIELKPSQEACTNQIWSLMESPNHQGYIVKTINANEDKVLDSGKIDFIDNFDWVNLLWGPKKWELHNTNHRHYNRQLWMLQESPQYTNFYTLTTSAVKNKNNNSVLTFSEDKLTFEENKNNDNQLWEFVPVNYRLSATIEKFKYAPRAYDLGSLAKKVSSVVWQASNQGSNEDKHHPSITKSFANNSTWSFSEREERNFLNQLDLDVKADFCGVKGPGVSVGNVSTSTHNTTKYEWNKTSLKDSKKIDLEATEISLISDISVPPHKKIEYKLIWEIVDEDIPFEADAKIRGFADRLKKDSSLASIALDADHVMALLPSMGYSGNVDFSKEGNNILVTQINGCVHVIGATKGMIEKVEYNL